MKTQSIKNILNETVSLLSPRTRSVIEKRFGLHSDTYQTLEAIGQNLGITRERVRQIESLGLKQLLNKNVLETLKPAFDAIEGHLKECGGIRREDKFLVEIADLLKINEKNRENVVNFVLTLGKNNFSYFKETPARYAAWALDADSYAASVGFVDALKKKLSDANSPVSENEIFKIAAAEFKDGNVSKKAVFSYINLCRQVSQNPFGEWGLVDSPEVSPKGVKDKAFLIFKKEKHPIHFNDVAKLINDVFLSDRRAHPQTVHNELIKDQRFVLVGRGTYALADWGYEPGTVRDVIVSILKNAKTGLTKNEIVKTVQSKRLVKDNTILLNLQNKKVFKKIDNERFTLA